MYSLPLHCKHRPGYFYWYKLSRRIARGVIVYQLECLLQLVFPGRALTHHVGKRAFHVLDDGVVDSRRVSKHGHRRQLLFDLLLRHLCHATNYHVHTRPKFCHTRQKRRNRQTAIEEIIARVSLTACFQNKADRAILGFLLENAWEWDRKNARQKG